MRLSLTALKFFARARCCAGVLGLIAILPCFGQAPVAINTITPSAPQPAVARGDRIIIKLKAGGSDAAVAALHRRVGAKEVRAIHALGLHAVHLPPGLSHVDALAIYRQHPAIEYAEPDYLLRALARPNDTNYLNLDQWNLHNTGIYGGVAGADIMAEAAWDLRTDASGVIVAVIDTGVRYTHEDLAANMWANPGETGLDAQGRDKRTNGVDDDNNGYIDDVHGINVLNHTGNPMDDWGHGTHVAGIIGGVGNNALGIAGIAWRIKLMACKFIDAQANYSISDAIACMDYAQRNGARIVTACWGNYSFNSTALRDAFTSLRNAGIIVTAAAGNDGNNNDVTPLYPASYPLDNIVAVAATDRTDTKVGWSNYGPNTVHIGAPGSPVWSTFGDSDHAYQYYDGTSMAAPHIAGACALIWSRFPTLTHQQVIQRILSTVDVLPSLSGRTKSGGRLNLAAALAANDTPAPPAAPASLTAAVATGPRIDLAWQDRSDNETGFQIERSTDQTNFALIASPAANATSYADTTVSAGSTYYYRIRAVANSSASSYSNTASVTTAPPPETVAAPTNLAAAASSSTSITLTWTDRSNNETGFQVERSADGTNFALVGTAAANVTSFASSGLASSTTYYFRVRAAGNTTFSAYSNPASATTTAPPLIAPSQLTATVNSPSQITLNWADNSTAETGFEVQRSTDNTTFAAIATTGANVTSFAVTVLSPSTTYYFRVRALQSGTASAFSNTASGTTSAGQPTPATWQATDIGGAASVMSITASGAGFGGTRDAFGFRYLLLNGDADVIARVTSLTNTNSQASAGVMIRESLADTARFAMVRATAGSGSGFVRRASTGAATTTTAGAISGVPAWLRLTRSGSTISAYESTNGTTWTPLGTVTWSMPAAAYVGLAVSSYADGVWCTATFDRVTIVQGSP